MNHFIFNQSINQEQSAYRRMFPAFCIEKLSTGMNDVSPEISISGFFFSFFMKDVLQTADFQVLIACIFPGFFDCPLGLFVDFLIWSNAKRAGIP